MHNILFVVDGTQPNTNASDFACFIANVTHSGLHAIFIQNIRGEAEPVLKQQYALPYVETITSEEFPENRKRAEDCAAHEKIFADMCMNRGVRQQIRNNRKADASMIIMESRFTDMIVLDPQTSFRTGDDGTPSEFVKKILSAAECPVVLSPYSFSAMEELIFPYDGSRSSIFAIRQFAYLFPQLATKKLTVLQINEEPSAGIKEKERLADLLQNHFTEIVYKQRIGNPGDKLFEYLLGKENAFVIMGAYG